MFKRKRIKFLLISLLSLLLIVNLFRWWVEYYLEIAIKQRLESFSKHQYKVDLGEVTLGLFSKNITLSKLHIIPLHNHSLPDSVPAAVFLKAADVKLRNMSIRKLILNDSLIFRKMILDAPDIILKLNPNYSGGELNAGEQENWLNLIIKEIVCTQAKIAIENPGDFDAELKLNSVHYLIAQNKLNVKGLSITTLLGNGENAELLVHQLNMHGMQWDKLTEDKLLEYSDAEMDGFELAANFKRESAARDTIASRAVRIYRKLNKDDAPRKKFRFKPGKTRIVDTQIFLNMFNDSLRLYAENLLFNFDSILSKEVEVKHEGNYKWVAQISGLKIRSLNVDSLFNHRKLVAGKLVLSNPVFESYFSSEKRNRRNKEDIEENNYALKINEVVLSNGSVRIRPTDKSVRSLTILKMNASVRGLDTRRVHHSYNGDWPLDELHLSTGNIFYQPATKWYKYFINQTVYDYNQKSAFVYEARLISNYSKEAFNKLQKYQTGRYEIRTGSIFLHDFNLPRMTTGGGFFVHKMVISDLDLNIYKDKTKPVNTSEDKQMPVAFLQSIKQPVHIHKIEFKKANLVSEVLSGKTQKLAKMKLLNCKGYLRNLYNAEGYFAQTGPPLQFYFNGFIMGAAPIELKADFEYKEAYPYLMEAEIGAVPFNTINSYIEQLSDISISKGVLDRAKIEIVGNVYRQELQMEMLYHDLNLEFLKSNRNQLKPRKRKSKQILSTIANAFILSSNPEPGKSIRKVEVELPFKNEKFVVNNWIDLVMQGMLESCAPQVSDYVDLQKQNSSRKSKRLGLLKRIFGRKQERK